jgi:UDP-N-acetylmuramate--alanine ligase
VSPTDLVVPDLGHARHVHVVAAGGAGMSAIASVLAERGHHVSGSDLAASQNLERLGALGVRTHVGHDAAHLGDAELVVVSTAVPEDNPEVLAARSRGVPVLRRVEVLSALARTQPLLSVSGTHGKTTTSAMLATALVAAGERPSWIVGADVAALGAPARSGDGRWFVLEADESDASFLAGPRDAALVTNVEPDHLEFWGGWQQLQDGFVEFLDATEGARLVGVDDPVAAELGRRTGAVGYGVHPSATYHVAELELSSLDLRFRLEHPGGSVVVELPVAGLHNALDAAGALAVVGELGADLEAAAAGLRDFTGAARRFERRGSAAGVQFVDDYAHLPTEVRAALDAGRSGDWNRLVVVFQPHRYSRTEALWQDFADAFGAADLLVLTEIYAAGEPPRPGVSGELLVEAVRAQHPGADLRWCPTLDDVVATLVAELAPGDLCMTVGAGDVTRVPDEVLAALAARDGGARDDGTRRGGSA